MKKSKRLHNFSIRTIIITIISLAIIGFLSYSVYTFQQSEESEEGFFICNQENTVCELSEHIHADINMTVCAQAINFPKEKGRLDKQHTHKENNLIHWHSRLKVDPKTQEPLNPASVTIKAFLDEMEYSFPSSCPDSPDPKISVLVNLQPVDNGLEYVWKDDDKVTITYE